MNRPPVVHKLKIWPGDFEAVRAGTKTCEIRRCDDRQFRVGDVLELRAFDPMAAGGIGAYLGVQYVQRVRITHVDRTAGPRMLLAAARSSLEDVVQVAAISFGKIST